MKPLYSDNVEISILYVEDEADAREMVGRALARKIHHLRLFTAENGEVGLNMFREHRPDIVITDMHMPMMDGIRMAGEIKALNPETLIVAVTAYSDTRYLLDAIEIGINHYVLKPVDYDKFFAVIDKCIEIVTLKKQVAYQNQHISRLSRVVEENPCSIVITDSRGIINYVNPQFTRLTGYSSEEVIGQNPRILKSDQLPTEAYGELWTTIIAGKVWRGEFLNRKKNGECYWESASISPFINDQGVITHFIAVKEDISERKRAEKEIELLNTELASHAIELEMANQELEAFSYTVSHDLRSPLTGILGFSQLLSELCAERPDEQCADYVQHILESARRMEQLITTLLDFSRLTHAKPNRETISLSKMAMSICLDLRMKEPERRVTLDIAEGITVNGDARLLRVVLENLLGNAWKYSGKKEAAIIEFGAIEGEGKPVCFVRDNGSGFNMADANSLFIPFKRLHDKDDFAGHGIGLATVHRIIKSHGGRIWAEGEVDKGATFYFTL
jgi:PAS domain S-box-containing protein